MKDNIYFRISYRLLAALTVPIKDTVKEIKLDSKKDLELLRDLSQTLFRLKQEFLDLRISKIIYGILCGISQQVHMDIL
jgi:hypothetical protein